MRKAGSGSRSRRTSPTATAPICVVWSARPLNSPGKQTASFEALRNEYETLEAEHVGADDLPEAVDQRLGEIETAMAAFENRPIRFDPADIARAGIFLSIDGDGASAGRARLRPT